MLQVIVKKCRVHGDLMIDQVIKQGSKNDIVKYRCKQCMSESHKKHYEKHKEKVRLAHKRYQAEDAEKYRKMKNESKRKCYFINPEKERLRKKEYRKINRHIENFRNSRYRKKHSQLMTDSWIKRLIVNRSILKHSDIPKEMVDLKRAIIFLKRQRKKMGAFKNVQDIKS